jgi:hypothetical protein
VSFHVIETRSGALAYVVVNSSGVKFLNSGGEQQDGVPVFREAFVVELQELVGAEMARAALGRGYGERQLPRVGVIEQRRKFVRQFAHRLLPSFVRNLLMIAASGRQCCCGRCPRQAVPDASPGDPASYRMGAV